MVLSPPASGDFGCVIERHGALYRDEYGWDERFETLVDDVLEDARRIYERFGFELVEEEKHHSFGHDLVGQNWWLTLSRSGIPRG